MAGGGRVVSKVAGGESMIARAVPPVGVVFSGHWLSMMWCLE